jgi:hypothetical protein
MKSLRSLIIALLICLGAIATSVQASAVHEYMVTTGPAGIWVLNVRNNSYVATVPGDPFVPHVTPAPWEAVPQPVSFALDASGAYLYAVYDLCYQVGGCDSESSELYSYRMIDGIPYQVSGVPFFAQLCPTCSSNLSSMVVSAHYVFLMRPGGDATILIFSTSNGSLKSVSQFNGSQLASIIDPLSLQVDAAEHFAYVNYASTEANIETNTPDHVAIYDITGLPSHPPRLIVTKPQMGGVLIGAQ